MLPGVRHQIQTKLEQKKKKQKRNILVEVSPMEEKTI